MYLNSEQYIGYIKLANNPPLPSAFLHTQDFTEICKSIPTPFQQPNNNEWDNTD